MFLTILVSGCGGGTVYLDEDYVDPDAPLDPADPLPTPGDDPGADADYREPGRFAVVESTERFGGASCDMTYDRYLPEGAQPDVLVVLAHGFSRSRGDVADHGRHLASWGLAVVAPDLCTSDVWNIDHDNNGDDLAALGDALSRGAPVVYVGHSAGGLATYLAAARSDAAIGQLGLDLVDSGDLARDAAPLAVPSFGLFGEPDACNAVGNGLPGYADAARITGADHCDFEAPTDALCTTFCPDGDGDDAAVRSVIRGLMTAWVLSVSGQAPSAADWVTPGGGVYEQLLAAGTITAP